MLYIHYLNQRLSHCCYSLHFTTSTSIISPSENDCVLQTPHHDSTSTDTNEDVADSSSSLPPLASSNVQDSPLPLSQSPQTDHFIPCLPRVNVKQSLINFILFHFKTQVVFIQHYSLKCTMLCLTSFSYCLPRMHYQSNSKFQKLPAPQADI